MNRGTVLAAGLTAFLLGGTALAKNDKDTLDPALSGLPQFHSRLWKLCLEIHPTDDEMPKLIAIFKGEEQDEMNVADEPKRPRREAMNTIHGETHRRVLAVLTLDQQAQLQQLENEDKLKNLDKGG